MTDPLRRYQVLAQAVSGRSLSLAWTTQKLAYTDGATIFISSGESAEARAALAVQGALLALGSLRRSRLAPLALARKGITQRYLLLEVSRAAEVPYFLPRTLVVRIRATYAGPVSGSAEMSMEKAFSRLALPDPPSWYGMIKVRALIRSAGADPSASDPAQLETTPELPAEDEEQDGEAERPRLLSRLSSPPGGMSPARSLQKLLGAKGSEAMQGTGDQELAGDGRRSLAEPRRTWSSMSPTALIQARVVQVVPGVLYPEWDFRKRAHREAWCRVVELDPAPVDKPAVLSPQRDPRLLRELARVGTNMARRRHQRDGDSLDMSALVEVEIDRRTGDLSEPRVFETRERTARDLGVLLLLDATGSTAEQDAGHSVFDEQRQIVNALTTSLEELGDRVATYAFNTRSRDNVRFLRVKGFDGRYDQAAQHRLCVLQPTGFTRLGAAVRHGTHLLTTGAGTANMLLVIIGDGLPYDDGYEDRYAREDSRAALREAMVAGVGCVSIGLRGSTPRAILDDVWGEVSHLALEHSAELAGRIQGVFGEALKLAAGRRRAPGGAPGKYLAAYSRSRPVTMSSGTMN